jgi:hypothetical protein
LNDFVHPQFGSPQLLVTERVEAEDLATVARIGTLRASGNLELTGQREKRHCDGDGECCGTGMDRTHGFLLPIQSDDQRKGDVITDRTARNS